MKIICINNPYTVWKITPGKIYELQINPDEIKYIIDDSENKFFFQDRTYTDYFIHINQWRDKQLLKLGI